MSGWKYKTRCSEHPQDLPKVYFCCHPDDFPGLFPEISDSILTNVRCAIWYADDDTPRDEDFFAMLAGMDLVVVPVTEKLLCEGCAAMREDIPFALSSEDGKAPIAFLPLLQSQSLESLYQDNLLLRNAQYICKDVLDPTVSSYEDKLKEYLNNVLLNAEQMKNIRAAFDGYIFFSYRKQDRKQLQDLLDAVHRFPFCRDIALWYDEYLPTGEDFYSNIHTVMDKSALFVLSYTDSVLADRDGKPNFVIKDEIPSAYKKLPMLTVQMNKTAEPDALVTKLLQTAKDHPILSEATPDQIRQTLCFVSKKDAAMKPALFAQLKQAPKNLLGPLLYELLANAADMDAMQQNDEDPEHNYLIGLAYLHGVDTVKDVPLATELLDFASKHGYVDATEKLVHIYRYGIGTAQDLDKAIFFQKRLIEQRELQYVLFPDRERLDKLIWAIIYCGDFHSLKKNQKQFNYAREKYYLAIKRCANCEDPQLELRYQCICYIRMGDTHYEEGNWLLANDYYSKLLSCSEELSAVNHLPPENNDYLSDAYARIGMINQILGDFTTAYAYYKQSVQLACKAERKVRTTASKYSLATKSLAFGDICMEVNNVLGAKGCYHASLNLALDISQYPTEKDHLILARCYERMGNYYKTLDEPQAAKYYFSEGLKIAKYAQSAVSLQVYSYCSGGLGDVCLAQGDLQAAKLHYESSLNFAARQRNSTIESQRALLNIYYKLGEFYSKERDLNLALIYFEKSVSLSSHIADRTVTQKDRQITINCYEKLCDVCLANGRLDDTIKYCQQGINLIRTLNHYSDSPGYCDALGNFYYLLALASPPAQKHFFLLKARDIYQILCDQYPDNLRYQGRLACIIKNLIS